jgi:hypothetical protein
MGLGKLLEKDATTDPGHQHPPPFVILLYQLPQESYHNTNSDLKKRMEESPHK